jgi:adenylate cyclase
MADRDLDGTTDVRRWLAESGARPDQLAAATDARSLASLASDLVLEAGAILSACDLAGRTGLPVERVTGLFQSFGVAVPDPQTPQFTEGDLQLVVGLLTEKVAGTAGPDLPRVVAAAMDRIAEAAVAAYVQDPDADVGEAGAELLDRARRNAAAAARGLDLGAVLGLLIRHHMIQALARQRVAQSKERRELARLSIGFVDLVGSTGIQAGLTPPELARMVSRFEALAFEVVASGGGRLVKFIGDEIMVAALDVESGCRIVGELVASFTADGMAPRGGLVHGDVLFRHGDYYGPVVNLAARLVAEAIPSEVLVDGSVVEATGDPSRFTPAGRRLLKGFRDPVAVWSLAEPAA